MSPVAGTVGWVPLLILSDASDAVAPLTSNHAKGAVVPIPKLPPELRVTIAVVPPSVVQSWLLPLSDLHIRSLSREPTAN